MRNTRPGMSHISSHVTCVPLLLSHIFMCVVHMFPPVYCVFAVLPGSFVCSITYQLLQIQVQTDVYCGHFFQYF